MVSSWLESWMRLCANSGRDEMASAVMSWMGVTGSTAGISIRSVVTIWAAAMAGLETPVRLIAVFKMVSCCRARVWATSRVCSLEAISHAHAAMFGVFGMLALAVMVFCLRAMQSDATWKETEKFVRFGFWGVNVGLALMITLDMFPGGVIQLWDSVANGYWHARRLTFLMGGIYHKLEWLRMVGDMGFCFCGAGFI